MNRFQIQIPATLRDVVGVTDTISKLRSATAYFTNFCHNTLVPKPGEDLQTLMVASELKIRNTLIADGSVALTQIGTSLRRLSPPFGRREGLGACREQNPRTQNPQLV
jgi:hypothetical protein